MGTDIARDMSNHCVVAPVAVIVGIDVFDIQKLLVDSCFFVCFANRSLDRIFVRVKSATRNGPGATTMCPRRTQLQQHMWLAHIEAHHQESGSAMKSPMAIATITKDPAVTVTQTHGQDVGTALGALRCSGPASAKPERTKMTITIEVIKKVGPRPRWS